MPNTPPRLAGFTAAATFSENAVNAAPQVLDADVALFDDEGNFPGGTIILSGLLGEDRVGIRDQGMGAGQIGLAGNQVFYEGNLIGAFSGGIGATLSISLSGSANTEAVDALIQNLTYANVSDRPTASRELVLNVTDGDGADLVPLPVPPSFTPLTGAANPFATLDTPQDAKPNFIDLDRDGDLDVVVGGINGRLKAFRNDGHGVFAELTGTANPFVGVDVGTFFSAPAFTDLDGDGDTDAVVGAANGRLRSFRNDGDGGFNELTGTANPFDGVDVGNSSAPAFTDLDGDGDTDAVVGVADGTLRSFRNNGDGSFNELTGTANPFNGVDVGEFATPGFVDVDDDGDLDTVVGQATGELSAFRNNGDGTVTWLPGAANPFNGWDVGDYSGPSFGDLDGDGDADALLGSDASSIEVFENITLHGQAIIVNVSAVNDAATLAGLATDVTFLERDVNAAPQRLDAHVEFADPDSGFDGGFVVVSGLLAEDRLAIRSEGNASGQIGLAGSNVTYGGIVIGSVFGGFGDTLAVFFNAAATAEAVDALIQNLTYANVSDMPVPSRGLLLGVTASDGSHVEQAINVHVAPGNDPPVLTDLAPSATFQEGAAPALIDANVTFAAVEGNVGAGTLTVSGLLTEDRVGIRNQGSGQDEIGVSGNAISYEGILVGTVAGGVGGTLTVTLEAAASVEAVDALIQNLTYFNVSNIPTASRQLVLNVTDAAGADLGPLPVPSSFVPLTGAANPFLSLATPIEPILGLTDLDRDGDLDVVAGGPDGKLQAFGNDGHGVFAELAGAANPFSGVDVGNFSAPAFIDLDDDGDIDAVIGSQPGTLRSFRNNGDGSFTELTGIANPFDGVQVNGYATPGFVDVDDDGDLDAVVGQSNGRLSTLRNNGDGTFTPLSGLSNPYDGIDVGNYSTPGFVDLDGDGDLDTVVGNGLGELISFRNNGDGTVSRLAGSANPFNDTDLGYFSAPSFGDLDGDGDPDALVGKQGSPLELFENVKPHGQTILVNVIPIIETVRSAVSFTLTANVENLLLTGTANINGTGNALNNVIAGNSGANLLNGGGGVDSLRGGDGDDIYVIGDAGDAAVETNALAAGGNDLVRSSISFQIGANIEALQLTGTSAINGTGNGLANTLTGNNAANVLNGGAGADRMKGDGGDDTYVVDNVGDVVIENSAADGTDTVRSSVTFSLAGQQLEHLVLTGTGIINGTGNALANNLTGNNAANILNGAAGADQMKGDGGNDTYVVDNVGDLVIENALADGTDTVQANVSYTLGSFLENLTLTGAAAIGGTGNTLGNAINGNNAANLIKGMAGADSLFGAGGADMLQGGIGDDTLSGGSGHDDLGGGTGRDGFRFDSALSAAGNVDDILDFNVADDTIFLDRDIFTGIAADGRLAAGAFRTGTAALDAGDRILYDAATGHIFYDSDGIGGAAAILFATVTPGLALTHSDFTAY